MTYNDNTTPAPDLSIGQTVKYWGVDPLHDGDTALIVNRGKGVLADGRPTWVIRLLFDNDDLWWVDDCEVDAV
jgi:hypothetical protein